METLLSLMFSRLRAYTPHLLRIFSRNKKSLQLVLLADPNRETSFRKRFTQYSRSCATMSPRLRKIALTGEETTVSSVFCEIFFLSFGKVINKTRDLCALFAGSAVLVVKYRSILPQTD